MTNSKSKEALELLVIQYLYGDLNPEQTEDFEAELKSNSLLKELLEAERRFDSAVPIGAQPVIDEERLQGNRWMLRQTLQKEARPSFSFKQILQGITERPLTVAFQGVAMAMTFVLGVMIATPDDSQNLNNPIPGLTQVASVDVSPLALVSDEDYEIYQLQVNSYDAMTGDIDLSFSLASETRLAGNVSDEGIHRLMAVALQDDIDSASRLDTINALQPVVTGNEVFEALIYVLQNDQNPGVRYQAVRSLVELTHEENVREALRYALSEDVNQGVRIEAFNALTSFRDEETLAVFRQQMEEDSNEYIRAQSRVIVEEVDGSDFIL